VFRYASTGCEQLQREVHREARSLDVEGSRVQAPSRNKEADFNQIQCDLAVSKCWCVDEEGFEVPGTRAATRDLVNCTGESTHKHGLVIRDAVIRQNF
jgi:hypothetical protein